MLAELQSVSKTYPGNEKPVFENISLQIKAGDSIAVTGPSGSGKSTLLNILGTLDVPSSGKILLNGQNVSEMTDNQKALLRNRFTGFVFQQHHLLPQLTLLENILLPAMAMKAVDKTEIISRGRILMEKAGIASLERKHPSNASVGECMRAAVVRALINKPSLILADEPTGALDNDNALKMAELLSLLPSETSTAIVVVTHSAEVASFMKEQYRLHSGKLEQA